MKPTVFKALLLCGTLILCFIFAEIVLRLLPSAADSRASRYTYVQKRGYHVFPPLEEIELSNEDGEIYTLRTDEHGLRNKPETLRDAEVLILGDSFISAVNTPEERTLVGAMSETGIRVYNAGMDGFSTFHAVHLLRNLLSNAKPKRVILAFYLGNDLRENYNGHLISDTTNVSLGMASSTGLRVKSAIARMINMSAVLRPLYIRKGLST